MNTTTKRNMNNPAAFIGKRIDITKWNIAGLDDVYAICSWTGKLFRTDDGASFYNYPFSSEWLSQHGVNIECAAYLSQEGFEQMLDIINPLLAEYGVDYMDIACGDVYVDDICSEWWFEMNHPYALARAA